MSGVSCIAARCLNNRPPVRPVKAVRSEKPSTPRQAVSGPSAFQCWRHRQARAASSVAWAAPARTNGTLNAFNWRATGVTFSPTRLKSRTAARGRSSLTKSMIDRCSRPQHPGTLRRSRPPRVPLQSAPRLLPPKRICLHHRFPKGRPFVLTAGS